MTDLTKLLLGPSATMDQELNERLLEVELAKEGSPSETPEILIPSLPRYERQSLGMTL